MPFDFDRIIPRAGTDSVKFDLRKQFFGREDVIPMWVADMDFPVPNFVQEVLQARAGHPVYGYSVLSQGYYESIIGWQQRRHGWTIRKEWIVFSPGVVTALNLLVQAFTQPGDKIVVQSPVYFPFFWAVERQDRLLLNNRLLEKENTYSIDFEGLEAMLRSGAKMLILCSPHNPVGRAWSREELERTGKLCLENGVLIVSDEIHGDLVLPGRRHLPLASLSQDLLGNTITCIAPSKTFNLAGLFTSSVIIPDEKLRRRFTETAEKVHISPNIFGAVTSEAAYRRGDDWLDQLLRYIEGNALLVKDFFRGANSRIRVSPLEATYLLWLDFREYGMSDEEIGKKLIGDAGVGMNPGHMFGAGGEGFQRMNLGCPRSIVQDAIERIAAAFS